MGKWIKPINARFYGDQQQAENMIGQVRKELGVLENLMGFRGLAIGHRARQFDDGSALRVGIVNGRAVADIVTPGMMPVPAVSRADKEQKPAEKKAVRSRPGGSEDEGTYYGEREWILNKEEGGGAVIVISSRSGEEAFAYDILTREIIVEKLDLESVYQALSEMTPFKYVNPDKLVPSQTDTRTVEILETGITDIPGLCNVPEFKWSRVNDVYQGEDLGCDNMGHADTYATDWYANESAKVINFDQSILINIDSEFPGEDYRGRFSLQWMCYAAGGNFKEKFSGGLLFNHHLFDPEPHPDWLRPVYNELEETCESEVNFFAQLYYQESCVYDGYDVSPQEQLIQRDQASGIANNNSITACFEDVVVRKDEEFTRHLRIFAKEREPVLSSIEQKAIDLINFERQNRDLPEFAWNHVLWIAAKRHSDDQAENLFYGHTGSDSSTYIDRATDAGFWAHETIVLPGGGEWGLGENAGRSSSGPKEEEDMPPNVNYSTYLDVISQDEYSAYGIAENMVAIWMASTAGHRDLLLHEDMVDCAISGESGSDGFTYWTFLAGFRHNFWPGFACVPTEDIVDYIDENFNFEGTGDEMKMLDIFLMEAEENDETP